MIRFASEEQAHRNSDRPEQREWWRDASQHLARVVFHDAPKVHTYRDGGSDQAGFVRIIQGHTDDMERMVGLGREQEKVLARDPPHILGMTLAEHADRPGDFTQTMYFASERDARHVDQERKDAYLITVELPGLEPEDLDITMEDGLLTLQGERKFTSETPEQQYHRVERRYGAFRRAITLPAHVMADGIQASFEDGVLQILVPRAEEATPKRIQVRPGRTKAPAASSEAVH